MTVGCVIFAYDGDIEYGPQAVLAARLVVKHLNIPVTLITDVNTYDKIDAGVFDKVIVFDENTANTRMLGDKEIAFKNTTRSSAYDLTPYDRTLVIDSDFLVLSDRLKTYLDADRDFMICPNMTDLHPTRTGSRVVLDPASIPMLWATNIIFNKTPEVEALFGMVAHVKEHWQFYGALYKFDTRRFRNDYAFSVACHTLGGLSIEKFHTDLPSPLLFNDKDTLLQVKGNTLSFLLDGDTLAKCQGQDVHFMNKYDLADNYEQLMELAND